MEALVMLLDCGLEGIPVHGCAIADLEHGCPHGLWSPLLDPVQVALVGLWLMFRQDPVGSL